MTGEKLPRELVWEGDHVSELGLSVVADGEEAILETEAVEHVEACERCTARLGRVSMQASAVGEVLALAKLPEASSSESRPSAPRPWRALAAGVVVAALAEAPSVHAVLHAHGLATLVSMRTIMVLVRSGVALATSDAVARGRPPAALIASVLLVLVSLALARWHGGTVEGSRS